MHLSYLTPSKRTYALGILTVTAGMLLSCNTTPMTAMTEEGDSFRTQDTFHDGMVILESVPSGEGSIREVPGEVVIAGTADGSRIDACSDSISPSELASIERRVSLDAAESVWTDPVRANPRAAIQEDLPHPDRGPQSDLIKLSAVGASAFALGGYVNQSFFNQQREEEAQTAREGATIRIRQLEEQLAAAEAAKRLQTAVDLYSQPAAEAEGLQTAVDFYNHTATLNNNTRCQLPDFFNQSCLLSAHPGWMKAAPLGMSAFLVGGYVAQKVRRSYKEVENRLAKSEEEKQAFQGQLKSEKEVRVQAEKKRLEAEAGKQAAERQLDTSREEKRAVDDQLTQRQGQLAASITGREAVDIQLMQTQGQLAESRTNADNLQGQLTESIAAATRSLAWNDAAKMGARRTNRNLQEQLAASTTNAVALLDAVQPLVRAASPAGHPRHHVSVVPGSENEVESIDHPGLFSTYSWQVHFLKKFGHWYANVNYNGKNAHDVPVMSPSPLSLSFNSLNRSKAHINFTYLDSNGKRDYVGINYIQILPGSSETNSNSAD